VNGFEALLRSWDMAEQVTANGAPGGGEMQPYITPDHYTHLRNFQASSTL